ncbi:DHA2 family efflux MFS transporter permease subunit [Microbacterium protaetiae]|uniref:DHA2 family efflux MFS transporter permease subunit n=1 Tax=Microbacterium protaetiae TaxID=2509458 RepID=A0A4P6ED21_9MICO|nr:MDR family MFS transporter [Microbacterium protaetiae]QAY60142.1 DHA2 family efflux MFS transporter permease subunit [Microbacterium protaetiae]
MTTTTPIPVGTAHPVSQRRLNLITLVLVLGAITTILDTTIVNIALDHLHMSFHATVADTQWVVTGYLLAYVAVIPVTGWACERFGTRRVWMSAVAVFMVGSLLCGFAWSLPSLIVFRVLQGIGGGMVLPVTITLITRAAGKERIGRAIATIGFIAQLGPILGPLIGGSILNSVGWNWLFFVNIPICLVALVLASIFLPVGMKDSARSLDIAGLVLLTPGVVALAYGISQAAGTNGFAAPGAWLPMVFGVVFIAAFVLRSLRAKNGALIDVRLFARRSFAFSSVITFVAGFSLYALMFLLPLFYQQIRGESVFTTGLLLIPQGLGTMCFILVNRHVAGRVDTRFVIAGGVLVSMIGILPFALAGVSGGDVILLGGQFLQGFGMAAVSLPLMTLAFASLSHEETPRGSAAFSIVKQVGAPFGVTVIAVILQHFLTGAATTPQALSAFNATFWWVLALSVVPLLFTFLMRGRKKADASSMTTPRAGDLEEEAMTAGHVDPASQSAGELTDKATASARRV